MYNLSKKAINKLAEENSLEKHSNGEYPDIFPWLIV